jgi:two-component system NtrC family sensor kinase
VLSDIAYKEGDPLRAAAITGGVRSLLAVPMLKDDELIGSISVYRTEVRPFSDKHVELVTNFATQAVIAIENVRLLNELRDSLQQQTATAEVLKTISRSTFDLQTVLHTLVESAARLCDAEKASITRQKDGQFYRAEFYGFSQDFIDYVRSVPVEPDRGTGSGRALLEGRIIHIADVHADPEYTWSNAQKLGDYRTLLGVPMLREGVPIGVLTLTRSEPRPFTDKQIELVSTFADQAAIAIENVRLFESLEARTREVQQSLEYQTAISDVLGVISRSPRELQPVLDAIVATAGRLCEADYAHFRLERDGLYHVVAHHELVPGLVEHLREPIAPGRGSLTGRVLDEGRTIHVPDVLTDAEDTYAASIGLPGRTLLGVPIVRDGAAIGVIGLFRRAARPFTPQQIDLVTAFANQAVIAINNVSLFGQVQSRTEALAQSLEELRAAQDRLVQTQKLAALGQLTAGVAHEIKNPLNFVNNFADLSAELMEELKVALRAPASDEAARAEADEIADAIAGNLRKVVQHGRRADSIVQSMLLHSREGSGERRSVQLNATAEEALNLAYHGARAENPEFNITLRRSLDPEAGMVDVYPQELVRVLLNVVGNGFYAARKRKAETPDGVFEPELMLSTRALADAVEIRVRDNGIGIPDEVRARLFDPFFTTKPAGEGTGLGLSLSHDIVVKQHGGTIDVETVPGEFTEFVITLPRRPNAPPGVS